MENNNYVLLTKKIDQLKLILLAAEALKKEDGKNFGKFEVIICGKEAGNITDPETMDDFLKMAKDEGVDIGACGFSLKKFEADPKKVPSRIKVVENGILYNLQLQKKGYNSLGL